MTTKSAHILVDHCQAGALLQMWSAAAGGDDRAAAFVVQMELVRVGFERGRVGCNSCGTSMATHDMIGAVSVAHLLDRPNAWPPKKSTPLVWCRKCAAGAGDSHAAMNRLASDALSWITGPPSHITQ